MKLIELTRSILKLVMNLALAWLVIFHFQENMFFMVTAAFWLIFGFAEIFESYEQKQNIERLMEEI